MDSNTLSTLAALIPAAVVIVTLFAVIVVALIVGLVLVLRQFVPALRDSVPADSWEKATEFMRAALLFGLNSGAAKTETLSDDEVFINGLRLTGAEVNGSPETGYTIVVPPK